MRTVIILTMSALTLPSVPAWAQQEASRDQIIEDRRVRALRDLQAQLVAAQAAMAQRAAQREALQAQLAALNAEEKAQQAKLDDLRKRYTDTHPDVMAAKARLAEIQAQEAGLAQAARRAPDAANSLKQASGGLQTGLAERWWKNPAAAQYLGLTADQQKKMDDAFQQSRSILMNLNFTLEREEKSLERLVAVQPLDESGITAQIDRVAQARAELEKANGRMLLAIRKQLTPKQWGEVSQISSLAPAAQK